MTTPAALTPYSWPVKELTRARRAFECALRGNFPRMEEHLRTLPAEAIVDLRYALDVMHPIVKAMTGPTGEVRPELRQRIVDADNLATMLRVPCGRCGHDMRRHGDRICADCPTGNCAPVIVPVGVAQTVTVTDGEAVG